ncbi:hypothetical protein LTR72_012469, partial [Exophiala xenobiotica]
LLRHDIRNDSDALHAHFGINVAGISISRSSSWSLTKANGRRPFAPEAGGNYEVFLERPMAGEILKYYDQDVMLMPRLLTVYGGKLQAGVAAQLQGIVDERIRPSKTDTFDGQGRHMAAGPHLAPTR